MLPTSGCFESHVLGREVVEGTTSGAQVTTNASINASTALSGKCVAGYKLGDQGVVSRCVLHSEGLLLWIFLDPIVLELPAGAANITGTFDGGSGNTGNLIVYPKLSFVPVDDIRTISAGPGKQLVILDLPDSAPVQGVNYQFNLSFQQLVQADPGPTQVKAMFTGKVKAPFGQKTFYPPMLPCTTDFAAVPTLIMPRSTVLQPITLPTGLAGLGCNHQPYFYNREGQVCDQDNDHDVDTADINLIMAVRNAAAAPGDPRDINADGWINANDARVCTLQCTRPRCAL